MQELDRVIVSVDPDYEVVDHIARETCLIAPRICVFLHNFSVRDCASPFTALGSDDVFRGFTYVIETSDFDSTQCLPRLGSNYQAVKHDEC